MVKMTNALLARQHKEPSLARNRRCSGIAKRAATAAARHRAWRNSDTPDIQDESRLTSRGGGQIECGGSGSQQNDRTENMRMRVDGGQHAST